MKYYLIYDPRTLHPYCLVSSTPDRTRWATNLLPLLQRPNFITSWHIGKLGASLEESFNLQGCQILATFDQLPTTDHIKTNYPEILL